MNLTFFDDDLFLIEEHCEEIIIIETIRRDFICIDNMVTRLIFQSLNYQIIFFSNLCANEQIFQD